MDVSPDGRHVMLMQTVWVPREFEHGGANRDAILFVLCGPDGSEAIPAALGQYPVGGDDVVAMFTSDSRLVAGNCIMCGYLGAGAYGDLVEASGGFFPAEPVNCIDVESGRAVLVPIEGLDRAFTPSPSVEYLPSPSGGRFAVLESFEGLTTSVWFGDWSAKGVTGSWGDPGEGRVVEGWLGDLGLILRGDPDPFLLDTYGGMHEFVTGTGLSRACVLTDGSWLFSRDGGETLEHGEIDSSTLRVTSRDTVAADGLLGGGILVALPGCGALALPAYGNGRAWLVPICDQRR